MNERKQQLGQQLRHRFLTFLNDAPLAVIPAGTLGGGMAISSGTGTKMSFKMTPEIAFSLK